MNDLSKTLFVGDLSIFCTKEDTYRLLFPFGKIESISLKTVKDGKSSFLFYCFVKYEQRVSGENAIDALNGKIFLGRPLR
jgi:RNA recognition motif-containing protein